MLPEELLAILLPHRKKIYFAAFSSFTWAIAIWAYCKFLTGYGEFPKWAEYGILCAVFIGAMLVFAYMDIHAYSKKHKLALDNADPNRPGISRQEKRALERQQRKAIKQKGN